MQPKPCEHFKVFKILQNQLQLRDNCHCQAQPQLNSTQTTELGTTELQLVFLFEVGESHLVIADKGESMKFWHYVQLILNAQMFTMTDGGGANLATIFSTLSHLLKRLQMQVWMSRNCPVMISIHICMIQKKSRQLHLVHRQLSALSGPAKKEERSKLFRALVAKHQLI